MIPLAQLRESPFNPRRTFNAAGLQELATDIRSQGLLQPLLVRPYMPNVLRTEPDPADGYELVFGHRRLRAAALAELLEVPCQVRAMSDLEVKRAQLSENLAREDVHPIEEAEGFHALMTFHDLSADKIVEDTGKSRSYVYGRLKLLQATKEVRDACLAGEIGSEVALLLARLRTDKLQQRALSYIRGKFLDMGDGGAKSFRNIRDLLAERFTLELKSAIFDIKAAELVPAAGACTTCPKRTANAPEFSDLAAKDADRQPWQRSPRGPDVCTDPDCFDEKKQAHLRLESEKLQAKGKVVIAGNKARAAIGADGQVKGGYIALKAVKDELGKARLAAQANPKITPPQVVTIQDPRTGKTVDVVKASDLEQAGVKVTAPTGRGPNPATQREYEERRAKQVEKAQEETAKRLQLLGQVRNQVAAAARSTFDLQMVVKLVVNEVSYETREDVLKLWGFDDLQALLDQLPRMSPDDQARMLLDFALVRHTRVEWHNVDEKPTALLAAAQHYGLQTSAKGRSTPSTAGARAAQGGSGKARNRRSAGAGADKGAPGSENVKDEAGCAGNEAKDEPADAGGACERDPNTADMFSGAEVAA